MATLVLVMATFVIVMATLVIAMATLVINSHDYTVIALATLVINSHGYSVSPVIEHKHAAGCSAAARMRFQKPLAVREIAQTVGQIVL